MVPGFHTSALGEHDLATAGAVLEQVGSRAIAVRLSRARLDPLADEVVRALQVASLRAGLGKMQLVVDADGRYLTDPWSSSPAGRIGQGADVRKGLDYLRGAIDLVGECGGGYVTFSTGPVPSGMESQEAMDQFMETASELWRRAGSRQVVLCVRPRPGHFVDSVGRFERLMHWTGADPVLSLAADVATMVTLGEIPVVDLLRRVGPRLRCVYLSDVRMGDAECWIGGGHVSAARVLSGLVEEGFAGPILVEPSEAEHADPHMAAALFQRLFSSSP